MDVGVCLLTDLPWAEAAPRWRAVEDMGFSHAWTYDHLVWGGLPESPWRAAFPTLAAAAGLTERIGLGTFVSSPNFRHPVTLHREVQALDDIAGGRFWLGLGAGGDRDSTALGGTPLSPRESVDRLQEFTDLTIRLRTEDHVDAEGRWFTARDARTLPPLRHVPLLLAGNGPRSVRYAARVGDGWITTGRRGETLEDWWDGVAANTDVLDRALDEHDRDRSTYRTYLSLDSSGHYSLTSVDAFVEMAGRAATLGFTDVVVHWPRPEPPYGGKESVLEQVAGRLGELT